MRPRPEFRMPVFFPELKGVDNTNFVIEGKQILSSIKFNPVVLVMPITDTGLKTTDISGIYFALPYAGYEKGNSLYDNTICIDVHRGVRGWRREQFCGSGSREQSHRAGIGKQPRRADGKQRGRADSANKQRLCGDRKLDRSGYRHSRQYRIAGRLSGLSRNSAWSLH